MSDPSASSNLQLLPVHPRIVYESFDIVFCQWLKIADRTCLAVPLWHLCDLLATSLLPPCDLLATFSRCHRTLLLSRFPHTCAHTGAHAWRGLGRTPRAPHPAVWKHLGPSWLAGRGGPAGSGARVVTGLRAGRLSLTLLLLSPFGVGVLDRHRCPLDRRGRAGANTKK